MDALLGGLSALILMSIASIFLCIILYFSLTRIKDSMFWKVSILASIMAGLIVGLFLSLTIVIVYELNEIEYELEDQPPSEMALPEPEPDTTLMMYYPMMEDTTGGAGM
jgi:hypothetical protein